MKKLILLILSLVLFGALFIPQRAIALENPFSEHPWFYVPRIDANGKLSFVCAGKLNRELEFSDGDLQLMIVKPDGNLEWFDIAQRKAFQSNGEWWAVGVAEEPTWGPLYAIYHPLILQGKALEFKFRTDASGFISPPCRFVFTHTMGLNETQKHNQPNEYLITTYTDSTEDILPRYKDAVIEAGQQNNLNVPTIFDEVYAFISNNNNNSTLRAIMQVQENGTYKDYVSEFYSRGVRLVLRNILLADKDFSFSERYELTNSNNEILNLGSSPEVRFCDSTFIHSYQTPEFCAGTTPPTSQESTEEETFEIQREEPPEGADISRGEELEDFRLLPAYTEGDACTLAPYAKASASALLVFLMLLSTLASSVFVRTRKH